MVERAGVGEDRQVDVRRDLERQRHAERADDVEDHLAARRRRDVEPVDRAVHPVADVVVDVDDEAPLEAAHAGAAQVAALHDDHRVGVGVGRHLGRDLDALHAGEVVVVIGRAIGVDDARLLAERVERIGHRQLRADGVAVGARVRGDQEARPGEDLVANPLDQRLCGRRRRRCAGGRRITHRCSARCGFGSSGVGCGAASPSAAAARSALDVVEDSLDAVAPLDRFVEEELQQGNPLEPEPAADLAAQEGRRPPERARRLAPGLLVAERRVIDAGDLQVRRDVHVRDGQEADARVVHLPGQEIGDLRAQLIADTAWSASVAGRLLRPS